MNPKALAFDKFMKAEEVTAFERKDFDDEDRFGICRCS